MRRHCSVGSGVLIIFMMIGGLALLYGHWMQQLGWMQESAQLRVQRWQQVCYMRAVRLRVASWVKEHYAVLHERFSQSIDPVRIPWPKPSEWPDAEIVVVATPCTSDDSRKGVSLHILCYRGTQRRLVCSARCFCSYVQYEAKSVFLITHVAD
ncbi:MAG: hypothetical protein US69_C0005G0007 [candidate division TM6 bacterium GW2011_GWF2_38_10]|nr:MAG: hypothetical protein US69_C0005G0007 [candidate division TM6 bacterium GW2011_GWF2_38_10]